MKCDACMQLLDDFMDGELPAAERRKVERHIDECDECGGEAEFLRRLSRDAASLPKEIQPDKDLWPGIEAEIMAASGSKNGRETSGDGEFARNWGRHKTAAWGWRIAAAAIIALILMAGAYLALRKHAGESTKRTPISNAPEKFSGITRSPSNGSQDSRPGVVAPGKKQIPAGTETLPFDNQPASRMITYPLDLSARVFVSKYGLFAVRVDPDLLLLAAGHNFILDFDKNGTQEWIPPLPPGSPVISVYPGPENRLWVSYAIGQLDYHIAIAELDFGVDSQVRNVWTSYDLDIGRFAVSPQGLIYGAGFRNEDRKAVAKLTRGQSLKAELLHIIDPGTGEEKSLFPVTLQPKFVSQYWAAQTMNEMAGLAMETVISVKSNGNFFVTMDRTAVPASIRDPIKNEAVEFSSDGTVAAKWDFGSLERDFYLNKIFVDLDDSILAEIVKLEDTGALDSSNKAIAERYLLRICADGRVMRYDPGLYSNEVLQGWIGQTRELVTAAKVGTMQRISIRRLPLDPD